MAELLAPGGCFQSAMRAFEHGADAVYLGLSEFSARKGAVNFTLDHLRRLRGAYPEKAIYLALNTLVAEKDMPRAASLIQEGCDAGIDALIVQDPGIAFLAGSLAPGLPLHASTQMAVYDSLGAQELWDAGFSRVVLARECSLDEIAAIRRDVPELELEVFIHGALCYGFSGLCQASQALLGRSANRGGCGQICRTWFSEGKNRLYPFSQNDLALGPKVIELTSLGVVSLKIEGRMKSPEYVGSVCAYYRAILDSRAEEAGTAALAEEAALRFSRNQTDGWLPGGKGRSMLNPLYPGPTGIPAGIVIAVDGKGMRLRAQTSLSSRDGLLWFGEGRPPEPIREALRFRDRSRTSLEKDGEAWLVTENPPAIGETLHKISRSDGRWPEINPAAYPAAKTAIALMITAEGDRISLKGQRDGFSWTLKPEQPLEAARSAGRFVPAMKKAFGASGESPYRCHPIQIHLNEQGSEPFIPPKDAKALRRSFLLGFDEAYQTWKAAKQEKALSLHAGAAHSTRSRIEYPHSLQRVDLLSEHWAPLPYPTDSQGISELPMIGGIRFLPLPPILFSTPQTSGDSAADEMWRRTKDLLAEPSPLCIGLSGQGHLQKARTLALEHPEAVSSGRLSFFLDYSLYVVNRRAWEWYKNRVPSLGFFIEGLESADDAWSKNASDVPAVPLGEGFPMPLFISRSCPIRHGGMGGNTAPGSCPKDCHGNRELTLSQNNKSYRIILRNCTAYVLADRTGGRI